MTQLENGIIFHQDNAPAHASEAVQDILAIIEFEMVLHALYSPDNAPSGFYLFNGF